MPHRPGRPVLFRGRDPGRRHSPPGSGGVVGGEIGHGGCTPSTTAPDGLIIGFTSMKLLLFIPCCDKKECRKADQVGPPTWITQARLPGTWSSLVAGRQRRGVQDNSTGGFRASAAYCGLLYSKAQRLGNCRRAHITVISAGYGVVGRMTRFTITTGR